MVRLSVNVNKVATLRNSRGGSVPSVVDAVGVVLAAGGRGITVHPRADERHITARDVRDLAALLAPRRARRRIQHRGRPAARPAGAGPRGAAASVHAGPGEGRRDHQPGRLAARHPEAGAGLGDCRAAPRRGAGEPVRRPRPGGHRAGRRPRRRPGGDLHRAVRPRLRARPGRDRRRVRGVCRRGSGGAPPGTRRQRRSRPRPAEPAAVQDAAAPRRSVDRPRVDQPCALRRPRHRRARVPGGRRGRRGERSTPSGMGGGGDRCWRRVREVAAAGRATAGVGRHADCGHPLPGGRRPGTGGRPGPHADAGSRRLARVRHQAAGRRGHLPGRRPARSRRVRRRRRRPRRRWRSTCRRR